MINKIIKCIITSILFLITSLTFCVGSFRFINLMCPVEASYFIKHIVVFFIPCCISNICFDILKAFSFFDHIRALYKHSASHNKDSIFKLIISIAILVISFVFELFALIGIYRYICLLAPIDLITYIKIVSPFIIGIIINECNKYISFDIW